MEKLMKAICITTNKEIEITEVPRPENDAPLHLVIKMKSCGINGGDIAFIGRSFPPGFIPVSLYNIWGVSGVGTVVETGEGVPAEFKGKKVMVYRSLQLSDKIIGTWSEYAQLHYLQCSILPENVNEEEYSGSLVNIITPFAFLKQVLGEGHKGIVCTAGNSATGIAMLGLCIAYDFPVISIVRNEEGKRELEKLGAKNVVVQDDANFETNLKEIAHKLEATAIFDGVGGAILNKIVDFIPNNSSIYCYGYLGGPTPLSFHTSVLMRGISIKGFSNFGTQTVKNPQKLEGALKDISKIIHMPHFKTKQGKHFKFEEINEALKFVSEDGGKAILYPF